MTRRKKKASRRRISARGEKKEKGHQHAIPMFVCAGFVTSRWIPSLWPWTIFDAIRRLAADIGSNK